MITVPAYVRRAWRFIEAWRFQQRRYRACPELRSLDQSERAARRAHKPVKPFRQQRSKLLHAELAREARHG